MWHVRLRWKSLQTLVRQHVMPLPARDPVLWVRVCLLRLALRLLSGGQLQTGIVWHGRTGGDCCSRSHRCSSQRRRCRRVHSGRSLPVLPYSGLSFPVHCVQSILLRDVLRWFSIWWKAKQCPRSPPRCRHSAVAAALGDRP